MTYLELLKSKAVVAQQRGMEPGELNPNLKPHARDIAAWMIRGGNRACFASFGLHKTSIQLQILESIVGADIAHLTLLADPAFADRPSGLIVCPLGVKHEFVKEAAARKFSFTPVYVRTNEELDDLQAKGHRHFLTNYERVRDGALDPNRFLVCSLDEAAVLRSFGSKTYQTFLTLFDKVPFKFVATATPDPNRHKELIHYAGFLGIMDTGQALTRFFKRDPQQAGNLQLHPHKEEEFRLWLSTWACFVDTPSDLGYSDDGYVMPKLNIHRHRLPVDHMTAGADSWGQGKMFREAATNLSAAAREKRDSLKDRVEQAAKIVDGRGKPLSIRDATITLVPKTKHQPPKTHWLIWHDLEDERRAIEEMFREAVTVYGTQDLEEREKAIADFADGEISILATKPKIAGSGCNLQRHCHSAIFLGIGFKFNDFIQAIHRIYRFGQTHEVDVHLIYTESEDKVLEVLMDKWERHKTQTSKMSELIRKYGLNSPMKEAAMQRAITESRAEEKGERYTLVHADNVPETQRMPDNSVDLIVTSWPFSDHYEYTELYNDFGHNDGDGADPRLLRTPRSETDLDATLGMAGVEFPFGGFFAQMDFLTPELKRILKPGRMYCVHAKDRLVYGSVSGLGMYSVNPFSDKCVAHIQRHGLVYCGRITIDTDVVRENAQTYRLGFSENAKDGTKMGVGSPEYILLFRKLPSDLSTSYADKPVTHPKPERHDEDGVVGPWTQGGKMIPGTGYSRSRWQFEASSFWRSSGNRFLKPEEIKQFSTQVLRKLWHEFNLTHVYDFEEHVKIAEQLEAAGMLPASFMLLNPRSHSPWVWDDVVRMRTLNTSQSHKRQEQHVCPLQIDIVERLIERFSEPGELVLDPFAGLGTVPFVALRMGRKGYGIELSPSYWVDSVGYCRSEEQKVLSPTLFDALEAEET